MISIGSFSDITNAYDEVWLIVRSLKSLPTGVNAIHVPQLSPSTDLFHRYLNWRNCGRWNKDTFLTKYLPQFCQEMHSKEAQTALNTLIERSAEGKNILLVCFCKDETLCHRSIVLGILQGILTDGGKTELVDWASQYVDYYLQYKKLDNKFASRLQKAHWNADNVFYLLIAGSRNYNNYAELCTVCDFLLKYQVQEGRHIVIVSGGARGADALAERYAEDRGYEKHIMPADWNKYGRSAGYHRNEAMHSYIVVHNCGFNHRGVVCFWDMQSRGTQHNFRLARDYGNPIRVFNTLEHRFLTDEQVESYT